MVHFVINLIETLEKHMMKLAHFKISIKEWLKNLEWILTLKHH